VIILDTSVWIEFLKGNVGYFAKVRELIEKQQVLAHEPIFAELLQGVKNKREDEIIHQYWTFLPKTNIRNSWIKAGEYSAQHKLLAFGVGIVDACILVAALETQSSIWTLDKKLRGALPTGLVFDLT